MGTNKFCGTVHMSSYLGA